MDLGVHYFQTNPYYLRNMRSFDSLVPGAGYGPHVVLAAQYPSGSWRAWRNTAGRFGEDCELGVSSISMFPKKNGNMRKPQTWKPPWKAGLHPLWKSSDREADAWQCGCYRPASLGYLWPCLQEAAGTVEGGQLYVLMWKWLHLSILFMIYAVQIVNS